MAEKQCSKCGKVKPLESFCWDIRRPRPQSCCRECRIAARRLWGERTGYKPPSNWGDGLERHRAARKKRVAAGLTSRGNVWERMPEYVARAAARGKEYWPQFREHGSDRQGNGSDRQGRSKPQPDGYNWLAVVNAQQAWSYWLRVRAPAWWVREAYREKPWNNPRLTESEKWRIRYWCDPSFRAGQIEKVQRTKEKRRQRIDATSDGTLSGDVIVRLFAEAKDCAYCGKRMRSVEKSLDHVIPLDRGGAHSITNAVIACKPCNFSKHTKTLAEWNGRSA